MASILHVVVNIVILLISIYTLRHYIFTLNRLVGKQRHPYVDVDTTEWPRVAVLVAAHNEEQVIAHSMQALLNVDYPQDRLEIVVVNDRSKDGTAQIVDDFVARFPDRIRPYHRKDGKPGKAAALKEAAMTIVDKDIILVFDADYIPGRGLIKQLVAPFFDPEIGLVMGRVVPVNTGRNLLTRLLDMERSGGYQVDQQARMNMGLVPQFGGTVGGVRKTALDDIGGWYDDTLAEDTDMTYRALLKGWKTVYQNRSECYEEVPETWPARMRQIMRWAKGHNQAFFRYAPQVLSNRNIGWTERLDAMLLLGVYAMSPVLLVGWIATVLLFYLDSPVFGNNSLVFLLLIAYATLGNFAAFFEMGSATYLDGTHKRIHLLPLNCLNFLISMFSISRATFGLMLSNNTLTWDKTPRYRNANFMLG